MRKGGIFYKLNFRFENSSHKKLKCTYSVLDTGKLKRVIESLSNFGNIIWNNVT